MASSRAAGPRHAALATPARPGRARSPSSAARLRGGLDLTEARGRPARTEPSPARRSLDGAGCIGSTRAGPAGMDPGNVEAPRFPDRVAETHAPAAPVRRGAESRHTRSCGRATRLPTVARPHRRAKSENQPSNAYRAMRPRLDRAGTTPSGEAVLDLGDSPLTLPTPPACARAGRIERTSVPARSPARQADLACRSRRALPWDGSASRWGRRRARDVNETDPLEGPAGHATPARAPGCQAGSRLSWRRGPEIARRYPAAATPLTRVGTRLVEARTVRAPSRPPRGWEELAAALAADRPRRCGVDARPRLPRLLHRQVVQTVGALRAGRRVL